MELTSLFNLKIFLRRYSVSVFLILFLLTTSGLWADGEERGWNLGTSVGIHWGRASEIVYDISGVENQNEYLSLLLWDLMNVPTVGVDARWHSGKKFILDLGFDMACPGLPVGEMEDYDWLYTDRDWSHWSISDVNLRWGCILDIDGKWCVLERRSFTLSCGVGYHLDWWAWTDTLVDSVYSTTSSSTYPGPFSDYPLDGFRDTEMSSSYYGMNGIDYQAAYQALLGIVCVQWMWPVPFLEICAKVGPVLAFSHDHHVIRGLNIYDVAIGGPWIDLTFRTGFRTSGNFSADLKVSYETLIESKGRSSYFYDTGVSFSSADIAGFSFYRVGLELRALWSL